MRPPKFHPNRSIDRRDIAFPTFWNMAAVRHLEFCNSGPPTKSIMRFDYPVKVWYRSDIPRRKYYDFIILPLWLENAYHAPFFVFLGVLNPLILWVVTQTPKRHILGTTRHLSHKWLNSAQGFDLGGVPRKKSITRTGLDRTGQQKSHKSVICHLFGGKLPVKYCNEIWHRGRRPRDSYVGGV